MSFEEREYLRAELAREDFESGRGDSPGLRAEIIERAKHAGAQVLLCGMETPPLHGLRYSFDFHEIYPTLADEQQIDLVPFLLAGVIGNPSLNLPDGIHPNAAGARRIADNIWAHLSPMLSAQTAGLRNW